MGKRWPRDPMRRFLFKILIGDDCWLWVGLKSSHGYGIFRLGKQWNYPVHRFSYEQFVGEIPAGCVVRRRCDNRLCVRPDHLDVRPMDAEKKESVKTRKARGRSEHPQTYQTRKLFNFALHNGRVKRPDRCVACMAECIPQGHHPDYSRPYYVVWLCRDCHSKVHRKHGPLDVSSLAIDYA